MTHSFTKNQILQAEVLDLTHEGMGVVKVDGYPFFVEGVLPSEEIVFKVIKIGKSFGYGRCLEILLESRDRVPLTDEIGRQTGTLTLQHMTYPAQLAFKQKLVQEAFQRIGHFEHVTVQPVLGMEDPWAYRNKAQIPVRQVGGQLETGFYRKNSHDLIPVENYYIQDAEIDRTILIIRNLLRKYQIPAYQEESHRGCIRHLIVRRGYYTGQLMVILVTKGNQLPHQDQLLEAMQEAIPNLVSVMQNINSAKTNVILGKTTHCLWGQDYFEDQMLGKRLRISAQSFYQVNTPQAEKLYQFAIQAAQLRGQERVLDAYCGIGSISLALADHAQEVYAMEVVPEAVEMARQNAQLNQITNTHFEAGLAEEWLHRWNSAGVKFDVIVVDPPRKGLDPQFIDSVLQQTPQKIVYVSCNPATQARDCRLFGDHGYQIQHIQPVDLFPYTSHVETVCLLTRK